jgi:phosphate transport system protein
MNRHISEQYDAELDSARSLLLEMGGLVEQQLQQACQSLYNHDLDLADKVRTGDAAINQLEVDIDDLCAQIIARRQPAATDLRTLISVMKASTDLERIGDEAERIAKMAQKVANLEQPADHYGDIREMASMVHVMLADALDAFARLSAEGAVKVIDADEAVDDAYDNIVKEKGAAMKSDPDSIEQSLTILWVARALERCGDHAKNLCEYIVYLVKGTDVRHADAAAAVSDS